jgi:hypothetical protein
VVELQRLFEEEDDSSWSEYDEGSNFSGETEWGESSEDESEEEGDPSQGNVLSSESDLPGPLHASTSRLRETSHSWTYDRPTKDPIPFTKTPGMTAPGDEP